MKIFILIRGLAKIYYANIIKRTQSNKNNFQRLFSKNCPYVSKDCNKMKQIEFQNHRKAPHPFQKYGNLPPAAFKNRSMPQDYVSLPRGQQAFLNRVGKKQFDHIQKSSIKQHWLGQSENDTLSKQVHQYHKVKGKSLQTRDIEGAQGGSLKPTVVKNKQRAQQLKMNGKINGFDHYAYEKEEYKLKIQNAVKQQHKNDVQIGRLISMKGHGHMLNPENNVSKDKNEKMNFNKNSKKIEDYQYELKQKYDNFSTKNEKYKQFFKDIKNQEESYSDFFHKLKRPAEFQNLPKKAQTQKPNTYEKYDQKQMPTPKITSRQYEYGLAQKFKTIQTQNRRKASEIQVKSQQDAWRQQQFLKNYQPPSFPKKSLESQFRAQHILGASLNVSRNYQDSLDVSPSLSSSQKNQNISMGERQKQASLFEAKIARKFNPTNLSHVAGSASYSFSSNDVFG